MWSEPQSGPGVSRWWYGSDCLLVKARSGLPVPLPVKQVWKSGPRKRSLLSVMSWCSWLPCALLFAWLSVRCCAFRSARR